LCDLTGMHKKSIEAAEKLKQQEDGSMPADRHCVPSDGGSLSSKDSQGQGQMSDLSGVDCKDDMRSESIATLRAKAVSYTAKLREAMTPYSAAGLLRMGGSDDVIMPSVTSSSVGGSETVAASTYMAQQQQTHHDRTQQQQQLSAGGVDEVGLRRAAATDEHLHHSLGLHPHPHHLHQLHQQPPLPSSVAAAAAADAYLHSLTAHSHIM
jgi:hypothetical protein